MQDEIAELRRQLEEAKRRREEERQAREDTEERREDAERRLQPNNPFHLLDRCHQCLSQRIQVETDATLTTQDNVTDPVNRVFPKRIVPWLDFPQLQADTNTRASTHPSNSYLAGWATPLKALPLIALFMDRQGNFKYHFVVESLSPDQNKRISVSQSLAGVAEISVKWHIGSEGGIFVRLGRLILIELGVSGKALSLILSLDNKLISTA